MLTVRIDAYTYYTSRTSLVNAVDLFSGVGGLSLGFKRAGYNVVAAFDNEPRHVETYSRNFPSTRMIEADISSVTAEDIFKYAGEPRNIDLVFGGPPCQGFSTAGRRNVHDERNQMLAEFARLVSEIMPRVFVAENVAGILTKKYAATIRSFYEQLGRFGYRIVEQPLVLDASQYGVPQRRKRVFFIGVRKTHPKLKLEDFRRIVQFDHVTVRDAIGDLPLAEMIEIASDGHRYFGQLGEATLYSQLMRSGDAVLTSAIREGIFSGLGGCELTEHSPEIRKRFAETVPGQCEPISRFHRLAWGGIAPTLRAGTPISHGKHMAARPIHPEDPRCITVREAARLHSFPDWFEFHPTKWYGFMGIGNSVPPLLAEVVAETIKALF